jgi:O-antigen/teichoic acid export membrane protein
VNSTRIVAGQSLYFLAGNIFTLFVGFAFQVYLARSLGANGIGLFGLLESGVAIVIGLVGLGISQVVVKFVPGMLDKKGDQGVINLIGSGFLMLLGIGFVATVVTVAILPLLVSVDSRFEGEEGMITLMALMIPLGLLLRFSNDVLRSFLNVKQVVVVTSFVQLTIKILITIVVFEFSRNVFGYVIGVVTSTAIALLLLLISVRSEIEKLDGTFQFEWRRNWRQFARTMYLTHLSIFWNRPLERIVIGWYIGPFAVGILVIAMTLYALPAIFLQMFLVVMSPLLSAAFSRGDRAEISRLYHLVLDWIVRLSLPLAVFLIVFSREVLGLFGSEFEAGWLLLILLVCGQLFNLICGPIGAVLNMCGEEARQLKISVQSVAVGTIGFFAALPFIGLHAVAVPILTSIFYNNLMCLRVAGKQLGIRWWNNKFARWVLPLVVAFTFLVAVKLWCSDGWVTLSGGLVGCYVLFHGIYLLVYGLNEDDRIVVSMILEKAGFSRRY